MADTPNTPPYVTGKEFKRHAPKDAYHPSIREGAGSVVVVEPSEKAKYVRHSDAVAHSASLGAQDAARAAGVAERADVVAVNQSAAQKLPNPIAKLVENLISGKPLFPGMPVASSPQVPEEFKEANQLQRQPIDILPPDEEPVQSPVVTVGGSGIIAPPTDELNTFRKQDLLRNADVISISTGFDVNNETVPEHQKTRLPKFSKSLFRDSGYSDPHGSNLEDNPRAMIVHAEGNEGRIGKGIQFDEHDFLHKHPHLVEVGAAGRAQDGSLYVKDYSSRSGPTVVTLLPMAEDGLGHKFDYVKSKKEVLDEFREDRPQAIVLAEELVAGTKDVDLPGDTVIEKAINTGLAVRTADRFINDPAYQQQLKQESHRKWIAEQGEILDGVKEQRDKTRTDGEGYSHNIEGTSFAQPYIAGQIGTHRGLHPELTADEVTVALTASGVPLTHVQGQGAVIQHVETPQGKFDPVYSGWGAVSPEGFARNVAQIAQIKKNNPELPSEERDLVAPISSSKPDGGVMRHEFVIASPEGSATTGIRTTVTLSVDKPMEMSPEMYVTSPGGTRMLVPFGRNTDSKDNVLGSTSGFQEKADGTWVVELPASVKVKGGSLNVHGVESGGVVDKFLEAKREERQQEQSQEKHSTPASEPAKPQAAMEPKPEFDKLLADANIPALPVTAGPSLPNGSTDLALATTAAVPAQSSDIQLG